MFGKRSDRAGVTGETPVTDAGAVIEVTADAAGSDAKTGPVTLSSWLVGRRDVLKYAGAVSFGGAVVKVVGAVESLNDVHAAVDKANEYWYNQLAIARREALAAIADARTEGEAVGQARGEERAVSLDIFAVREAKAIARMLNGGAPYHGATLFMGELREHDSDLDTTEWTTTSYPIVLGAATSGDSNRLAKIRSLANGEVSVEFVPFDPEKMSLVPYAGAPTGEANPWMLANLRADVTHNSGTPHAVVYGWDQTGAQLPVPPAVERLTVAK